LSAMGPKAAGALDRLTEMLADARQFNYPTVRYRSLRNKFQVNVSVVWVLRSIGPQAVPALVTALKNEDENVRLPAIQSLCEMRQPVMLDVWLEAVHDGNQYVQIYAARELAKSKSPAARDALCKVLQDDDVEVRIEVAQALGQIGDELAINPLIEALPVGKVNLRLESAVGEALSKIGVPAVKVLLERFKAFDENGRRMANMAIGKVDARQAGPLLLECVTSEHWQVREAAVIALASLKTPESLRVVTESVDDPDWNVRWTAARLLGTLVDDKSAGAIRAILLKMAVNDPHARVRDKALWTLYYLPGIPTDEYRKTIEGSLNDDSPRARATAACSCSKLPNARFGLRLKELLNDADGFVRAESAAALPAEV
jgi:HEAT repeat protein